jgi:DNA-binding MarR family transcriptional regulator
MASRNKKHDPQKHDAQPGDAAPLAAGESGRFAYEGLERVIHEKARLSIMSSLAAHPDGLLFNDLKDLCSLTDGNLSRHMQLLQESKLVEVWKGFKNNRPQTLVRLTDAGKKRFLEYVQELEQVVADAMAATGRAAPARLPLSKGLSPA